MKEGVSFLVFDPVRIEQDVDVGMWEEKSPMAENLSAFVASIAQRLVIVAHLSAPVFAKMRVLFDDPALLIHNASAVLYFHHFLRPNFDLRVGMRLFAVPFGY
jgi:hypothetical protein